MILIYILHIEFHWGYRPRISIRRKPRVGDRMINGGVPGTLVGCPTCSTDGFLHQEDSMAGLWPEPPVPVQKKPLFPPAEIHHWQGSSCLECEADVSWCQHPHIRKPEPPPDDIDRIIRTGY